MLPNDRRLSMLQNSDIENNEVYTSILGKIESLNLKHNLIRLLPLSFKKIFVNLKEFNVQYNRIISIKDDVIARLLDPKTKENYSLEVFHINLTREDEVEFIIKRFRALKNLNGIIVDRAELAIEESQPTATQQDTLNTL
jgi:sporulation protein YlmC with PRC-barrel domain